MQMTRTVTLFVGLMLMAPGGCAVYDHGDDLDVDGGADAQAMGEALTAPLAAPLRYNRVQQKSSHNSFQRHEALVDQMVYHRVRSLELDIHNGKGFSSVSRDWFVYHTYLIDDKSSCNKLSDCLRDIHAIDQAIPDHEVVTLWIDLKDSWDSTHQPADLDALLTGVLGDRLVTPATLMAACPGATTLRQAVTGACAWPTLDELRGKYIAVLTGGGVGPGTRLSQYVASGGNPFARAAFVAPDLSSAGDILAHPNVIFHNMSSGNRGHASAVYDAGVVGRVWGINTSSSWSATASAKAHHIATDKINYHRDPWAVTHDSQGFPFTCLETCTHGPEIAPLIGMRINTGDIWNRADSFLYLHSPTPAGAHSLTAMVSTVNSHVDEWAKGCLMARQSTDPGAPYFAVCRPADKRKLRVQYRKSSGGSSSAVEANITPSNTIAHDSVVYVRLDLSSDARCATGYGSQNGRDWVQISAQCYSAPLAREGLAASSHGSGTATLIFGDVTRAAGSSQTLSRSSFAATTAIGTSASGSAYDGWRP